MIKHHRSQIEEEGGYIMLVFKFILVFWVSPRTRLHTLMLKTPVFTLYLKLLYFSACLFKTTSRKK